MRLRSLLIAVFALFLTTSAFARLRPGFNLEYNTWQATDIILIRDDGKLRPKVTVLESWKGTLRPGDSIVVSGLPAADAPRPKLDPDIAPFPDAVDGGYIVFFLHQRNAGPLNLPDGPWAGLAQDDKFLYTSAVFIRGHLALHFSLHGVTNFQADTLDSSGPTDTQFHSEVDAILKTQQSLLKIATLNSPEERAKALLPIAQNSYSCAQREALQLLGQCGQPAVPMLRTLTITESKHCDWDRYSYPVSFEHDISNALAAAAGPNRDKEFIPIIVEELAYWKKTAPTLSVGWWNKLPDADEPRAHYGRLYSALKNLKGVYKPMPDDPVKQLRDLWASLPQLNDKSGLSQMIEACDAAYR